MQTYKPIYILRARGWTYASGINVRCFEFYEDQNWLTNVLQLR